MSIENVKEFKEQADAFAPLYSHKYMLLTTYRKNGDAVPTPVWFAPEHGKLYVMTIGNAGKVKRIRNQAHVTLAPCGQNGKVLGPSIEARARELPAESFSRALHLLKQKYGLMHGLFTFLGRLRKVQRTFIEIEPA